MPSSLLSDLAIVFWRSSRIRRVASVSLSVVTIVGVHRLLDLFRVEPGETSVDSPSQKPSVLSSEGLPSVVVVMIEASVFSLEVWLVLEMSLPAKLCVLRICPADGCCSCGGSTGTCGRAVPSSRLSASFEIISHLSFWMSVLRPLSLSCEKSLKG